MKRMTKAELVARVVELEEQLAEAKADVEHMQENYYSEDSVHEQICEAVEEIERQRDAELRRREPEYHRANFRVLNGGAA